MRSNYSVGIADTIVIFLKEKNMPYFFDQEQGIFQLDSYIPGKIKKLDIEIRVHPNDYTICAISPLRVDREDKKAMQEMAEFLSRVNFSMKRGNFELNMNDGEIRYKTFVDCDDQLLSRKVFFNSYHCPQSMFHRYGAGIMDVCFGQASAEEALEKCEEAYAASVEALSRKRAEAAEDQPASELMEELKRKIAQALAEQAAEDPCSIPDRASAEQSDEVNPQISKLFEDLKSSTEE